MSGGPRSRFPRTAKSVSDGGITIEREKIRHRRPDDMRLVQNDDAPSAADDNAAQHWPEDQAFDDTQSSWSDSGESDAWTEQSDASQDRSQDWDDSADEEWVIDDPQASGPAAADSSRTHPSANEGSSGQAGLVLDDGGVTWGDDADIRMGGSNAHQGYDENEKLGPEVELAGRRDVRPRPPKRPRPPQAMPRQPVDDNHAYAEPAEDFGEAEDDFALEGAPVPPPMPRAPAGRAPKARPRQGLQPRGRVARAQGPLEIAPEGPSSVPRMPPPPPSRRRQPQPSIPVSGGKKRSGKGSSLMILAMVAVIGAGGWLAYQSFSGEGGDDLIGRLGEGLGVTETGRTGSDTPFGSSTPTDGNFATTNTAPDTTEFLPTAPGSQTGGSPGNPTSAAGELPPIPQFRPGNNEPAPGTNAGTTVQVQELEVVPTAPPPPAETAADESEEGPSVMQKIWGNLISN